MPILNAILYDYETNGQHRYVAHEVSTDSIGVEETKDGAIRELARGIEVLFDEARKDGRVEVVRRGRDIPNKVKELYQKVLLTSGEYVARVFEADESNVKLIVYDMSEI